MKINIRRQIQKSSPLLVSDLNTVISAWLMYPVFSASNQITFDNRCEKQYDNSWKLAIGIGNVVLSIMVLHNEKIEQENKKRISILFFKFYF